MKLEKLVFGVLLTTMALLFGCTGGGAHQLPPPSSGNVAVDPSDEPPVTTNPDGSLGVQSTTQSSAPNRAITYKGLN